MASFVELCEKLCRWLANAAGFAVLEESKIRLALKKMIFLGAGAWLLGLLGLTGIISPFAALFLMSAVAFVLVGAVLISSEVQQELANIAVSATTQTEQETSALSELDALSALFASSGTDDAAAQTPSTAKPPSAPQGEGRMILHTGKLEGRNYCVFTDGSIEIDTAYGRRWFESIDHAHVFIGLDRKTSIKSGRIELASVA